MRTGAHSQYDDDDHLWVNVPRLRLISDKRREGPQTKQKGPLDKDHEEFVIARADALTDPFAATMRVRPHFDVWQALTWTMMVVSEDTLGTR